MKKPRAFIWNEKNTLWEVIEGLPKINTAIHDLLVPEFEKNIEQAKQNLHRYLTEGKAESIHDWCERS